MIIEKELKENAKRIFNEMAKSATEYEKKLETQFLAPIYEHVFKLGFLDSNFGDAILSGFSGFVKQYERVWITHTLRSYRAMWQYIIDTAIEKNDRRKGETKESVYLESIHDARTEFFTSDLIKKSVKEYFDEYQDIRILQKSLEAYDEIHGFDNFGSVKFYLEFNKFLVSIKPNRNETRELQWYIDSLLEFFNSRNLKLESMDKVNLKTV